MVTTATSPSAAKRVLAALPRVLLGLLFLVLGVSGFVPFMPVPPAIPANAATFFGLLVATHFSYFVFGVQVLCGVLLLANRYVNLALVLLGAVIANILVFHLTMWPASLIPMPLLAVVLWFLTAWPLRGSFAPLFSSQPQRNNGP